MKLAYFVYPYSDNPRRRFKQIMEKVKKLCKRRQDLIPIIPHQFDYIFGLQTGYTQLFIMGWNLELISRADILCIFPDASSCGTKWETAFAQWLIDHGYNLRIYSYEDLWSGKDLEQEKD